jgi:hypothetical protein
MFKPIKIPTKTDEEKWHGNYIYNPTNVKRMQKRGIMEYKIGEYRCE